MKRDTLENALFEISDSHIAEATQPKKKRKFYWLGAAAAILALVLVLNLLPKPNSAPHSDPPLVVHAHAVSESEGSRGLMRISTAGLFSAWSAKKS